MIAYFKNILSCASKGFKVTILTIAVTSLASAVAWGVKDYLEIRENYVKRTELTCVVKDITENSKYMNNIVLNRIDSMNVDINNQMQRMHETMIEGNRSFERQLDRIYKTIDKK